MAQGKELKFQFVLDDQSFQRVKRALGELQTEAQKLAKTLQQAGGGLFGGANVGKGVPSAQQTQGRSAGGIANVNMGGTGLSGAILKDVNAFKALAKTGTDTMKAMQDAAASSLRAQIQSVEQLDRKIKLLQDRYSGLKTEAQKANSAQAMMQLSSQRAQGMESVQSLHDLNYQMQNPAFGATFPASPNFGGGKSLFATAKSAMGAAGPIAAAITAGIAAGVKGASTIYSVGSNVTEANSTNIAARGNLLSPMLSKTRNADISDQLKLRYIATLGDTEKAKLFARLGGDRQGADDLQSTLGMLKGDIASATTLATDNRKMERMREIIQVAGEDTRYTEGLGRAYDFAESSRAERVSASRIRGSGYYKQKVGGALTLTDPITGKALVRDTFTERTAALHERGYSNADADAATVQARNLAGVRFASRHSDAIMAANAVGYGGYAPLLAAAERSGGGSAAAAMLALGGKIATAAGLALGQGVLGSGFDVRGTTSGIGILNAAQGPGFSFGGGVGDFNQVQQLLAGVGLGSSVVGGSLDTYQAGRNIINAIGLNPNGSTYAQDYLGAGMDFKQMTDAARGNLTKTASALGITPEMARKQLSGSLSSVMERFVDQNSDDPMSRAIRGYRESGLSVDKYLTKLYKSGKGGEADAIGSFFGLASGQGEEAGIGLTKVLAGLDYNGTGARSGPGGGLDDETKAKLKAQADQIRQSGALVGDFLSDLNAAFGDNKGLGGLVGSFGKLEDSIEDVVVAFSALAGITPAVQEAINQTGASATLKQVFSGPAGAAIVKAVAKTLLDRKNPQ
jgi:hypothetical protein